MKEACPCVDCGTTGGSKSGKAKRPARLNGQRFGVSGQLCHKCFKNRLNRNRTRHPEKARKRPAAERPRLTPEQSRMVADHWRRARHLARKHAEKHPELDLDWETAAAEALCDVASRFTDDHAAKFWTFASYRVKGAFLDEMRKNRLKGYPRGRDEGKPKVHSFDTAGAAMARGDDEIGLTWHSTTPSDELPPGWEIQWEENVESLAGSLEWLPREVVILSYLYGFTLEKIGRVLNISETWASKIRINAISLMSRSVDPETYYDWRVSA